MAKFADWAMRALGYALLCYIITPLFERGLHVRPKDWTPDTATIVICLLVGAVGSAWKVVLRPLDPTA